MTAFAGLDPGSVQSFIERIGEADFPAARDRWKQLQAEGWDVVVLYEFDGHEIVGLGWRYRAIGALEDRLAS